MVAPGFGTPARLSPVGLIEVCDVVRHDDSVAVTVLVHPLADSTNIKLVSQYEESGGDEKSLPSQEERLEMAEDARPAQRIHKWILTDGEWMKAQADIILLQGF